MTALWILVGVIVYVLVTTTMLWAMFKLVRWLGDEKGTG